MRVELVSDTQHESLGSAWLSQHFGPEVSEPVRLHVAAKRYLSASEAGYFELLSEASKLSLKLQGGPMTQEEQAKFGSERFFQQAVALRRWDESAWTPHLSLGYRTISATVSRN